MTDNASLIEIHRALGRIEGKQDALLANQETLKEDHATLRGDHTKLSDKVHAISLRVNWYAGGGAAVVFLLTFFKDKIGALIP